MTRCCLLRYDNMGCCSMAAPPSCTTHNWSSQIISVISDLIWHSLLNNYAPQPPMHCCFISIRFIPRKHSPSRFVPWNRSYAYKATMHRGQWCITLLLLVFYTTGSSNSFSTIYDKNIRLYRSDISTIYYLYFGCSCETLCQHHAVICACAAAAHVLRAIAAANISHKIMSK